VRHVAASAQGQSAQNQQTIRKGESWRSKIEGKRSWEFGFVLLKLTESHSPPNENYSIEIAGDATAAECW
jgi:hypothetical protein